MRISMPNHSGFGLLSTGLIGAILLLGLVALWSGGAQAGDDLVDFKSLDKVTKGAFTGKFSNRDHQIERGLLESKLIPVYPEGADCPKIDHIYGEAWQGPVAGKFHTGTDIPAWWDDPIYAMADGEVVAKFTGERGYRGLQIVLRHSPEDTGLPVWIYTLYSHFSSMPEVEIGQRVRIGDVLGPNGKSGVPGEMREPHLHLTVSFSKSPKYARNKWLLVPMEGHYADPVALFRGKMPIDTQAMRALPKSERRVKIAYKLETGKIVPPGAKIIWPFACDPD
jgi:murein DD-endopeptidase MepM/ murein hydrolase activator NlpD